MVSREARKAGWLVPTSAQKPWLRHQPPLRAWVPWPRPRLVPVHRSASSHPESSSGQVPSMEKHSGNVSRRNTGIYLHTQKRMLCPYCCVPLDEPLNLSAGGGDDSANAQGCCEDEVVDSNRLTVQGCFMGDGVCAWQVRGIAGPHVHLPLSRL